MSRTHRRTRTPQSTRPRWTTCATSGKRGYLSQHDALIGATSLPTDYVRTYRCPDCERWHVTTSPPRRKVRTDRTDKGIRPERKEVMAKNDDKVLDPTRSEERAALDAAKDDGFEPKIVKGYEVVRYSGERVYFSDDKADAEDRLKGLAALTDGIGGKDGNGEPAYTIREVSYIEVEGFDKSGPESRTRGKHDGSPADPEDQDNPA